MKIYNIMLRTKDNEGYDDTPVYICSFKTHSVAFNYIETLKRILKDIPKQLDESEFFYKIANKYYIEEAEVNIELHEAIKEFVHKWNIKEKIYFNANTKIETKIVFDEKAFKWDIVESKFVRRDND